jgi:hypothetical protein
VDAGHPDPIRSVKSLLTATMQGMAAGTAADRIAGECFQIASSVVIAGTAISRYATAGIAIVISIEIETGVAAGDPFLTPSRCIRIMTCGIFADVAELADAQVSEACDGDIVEVQVLSSAPKTTIQRLR